MAAVWMSCLPKCEQIWFSPGKDMLQTGRGASAMTDYIEFIDSPAIRNLGPLLSYWNEKITFDDLLATLQQTGDADSSSECREWWETDR